MSIDLLTRDINEIVNLFSTNMNYNTGLSALSVNDSQLKALASGFGVSHVSVDNHMDPSVMFSSSSSSEKYKVEPKKEYKRLSFNKNTNDYYEGTVLLNNLHGYGFYSTQKDGQKLFYDGLFYVNKLEGYSQVFYENGTHFQGLFKQHKRFGPGVLTYPDGTQDIGFWDGFNLIRLAAVVGADIVPRLANTVSGTTKLVCCKNLIPICDTEDSQKSHFKNMGSGGEVFERSDALFNLAIRNPNSLFFNRRFYDYHFFGGKDCTIKVATDDKQEMESTNEEKEEDNDELMIRMKCLNSKIKEMDDCLQPFVAIKKNLEEKIRYCKHCCKEPEIEPEPDLKVQTEVEDQAGYISNSPKTEEDIILSFADMSPNFMDGSLPSVDSYPEMFTTEPSNPSVQSPVENIVDYCACEEQYEMEDLQVLEDQLSNITTQETFYRNIRDSLQNKLDHLLDKKEKNNQVETNFKLVEVTELWAWSNEEFMMKVQKHCFKHRNFEEMVNFSVPNLIFGGRTGFKGIGKHEDMCHKFLISCSKNKKKVRSYLMGNVNPNITDARGNSGVFFAVAKNEIEIISILANYGAKLDQLNDEELTPLSLSILKYLSQKSNCRDWEQAFLSESPVCEVPDLPKWYDIQSFLSLSSVSSLSFSSSDNQSSQNEYSNSRIIELFRKLSNIQQKSSNFILGSSNTPYVFDLAYRQTVLCSSDRPEVNTQNEENVKELKAIHVTIITLLEYGADPNIPNIPYPPLILSLFSENPDIVEKMLKARADVHVLATEDNLSCLHILCSLSKSESNVKICKLLLEHHCDPNLKALLTHWQDCKSYFIGNISEELMIEDRGKNALHLLCMRKDFDDNCNYFSLLSETLISFGVDCNETYLGHTALSLAVLVGNVTLVESLIKTNLFNPYKSLDNGMGNVLTLFTLKRFENSLPTDKCKAMLTALHEANINVLVKVDEAENAIAFAEEGDVLFKVKLQEKTENRPGKAGKAKSQPKAKKIDRHSQSSVILEFMKDIGRQTIIRQIELLATEILYEFTEENILQNLEIAVVLAEFLTPKLAITNLEDLFQYEQFGNDRVDLNLIKILLDFVNLNKKIIKSKKGGKPAPNPKGKKEKDISRTVPKEETMEELLAEANFKKPTIVLPNDNHLLVRPGFDNPKSYHVCFHCIKGQNKILKVCPRCQMIHFCSIQCNKLNMKVKSQHTCNIVYYDMTDEQYRELTKNESLEELIKKVRKSCQERLQKARTLKLLQEEQKLLDMWRADTYGTKFLEYKPKIKKLMKSGHETGVSWNLKGLQNLLEKNYQKNPADPKSYSIEAVLRGFHVKKRAKLESRQQENNLRKSTVCSVLGSKLASDFLDKFYAKNDQLDDKISERRWRKYEIPKEENTPDLTDEPSHSKYQQTEEPKPLPSKQLLPRLHHHGTELHQSKFEKSHVDFKVYETSAIMKKLKKIPEKYQKFLATMAKYFPEIDLSFWLLPYACCSNGQLFYKFCDSEGFSESYSFL